MPSTEIQNTKKLAHITGWSLLATIVIGMISAFTIAKGIDVNLTADIGAISEAMLDADTKLRAKAYIGAFLFGLGVLVSVGFYLILNTFGKATALWSLIVSITAAILALLASVFALNAAYIAGNEAYANMQDNKLLLLNLQATSDYTAFHLSLVLSSVANAGFFYLFLKSGLIPKLIAGWGVFASLFVAVTIVARDFIPFLGHGGITAAFMLSNMIALLATALYLGIKGVRA